MLLRDLHYNYNWVDKTADDSGKENGGKIEVLCSKCGGHPTNLYVISSASASQDVRQKQIPQILQLILQQI